MRNIDEFDVIASDSFADVKTVTGAALDAFEACNRQKCADIAADIARKYTAQSPEGETDATVENRH